MKSQLFNLNAERALFGLCAERTLFNLCVANKGRGSFHAEAKAGENVIELYDMIVCREKDAEWFGGVSLQAFSSALRSMNGEVHLRINSPGGDVFAGLAMAQLVREYDGDVVAHVDGYAASAASVLAVACDRVIMGSGSMMMIHKAWTFWGGNADDFLAQAAVLEKIDGQLAAEYAARSGKQDAAAFLAMMGKTTWLTPTEAKDLGLCDETSAGNESKGPKAWDLSAYGLEPDAANLDRVVRETRARVEAQHVQPAPPAPAPLSNSEFEHDQRQRRARLLALSA